MKPYFFIPLLCQKLIWIPTRLLLVLFGKLTIKGRHNLAHIKGPVIFVANHSSEIDPFMVPVSLPFFSRFSPLFYVVLDKSFYINVGWRKHLFNGWFIKMWGGYSAAVGPRDYAKSLEDHTDILRDGGSFCVFPEGGITKDGKLRPAKGGVSFLAHSAPSAVVPVAISGVYKMSAPDFFRGKHTITIHFGEPIKPEDLYSKIRQPHVSGQSVWREEADYIMRKVADLIEP